MESELLSEWTHYRAKNQNIAEHDHHFCFIMPTKRCSRGSCNSDNRYKHKPQMAGVEFHPFPKPKTQLALQSQMWYHCILYICRSLSWTATHVHVLQWWCSLYQQDSQISICCFYCGPLPASDWYFWISDIYTQWLEIPVIPVLIADFLTSPCCGMWDKHGKFLSLEASPMIWHVFFAWDWKDIVDRLNLVIYELMWMNATEAYLDG